MNWAAIDQLLDANLAATLSGLSLAAAAFLGPEIEAAKDELRGKSGLELLAAEQNRNRLQGARNFLLYAAFAFLTSLLSSLTIDPSAILGPHSTGAIEPFAPPDAITVEIFEWLTSPVATALGISGLAIGMYQLSPFGRASQPNLPPSR